MHNLEIFYLQALKPWAEDSGIEFCKIDHDRYTDLLYNPEDDECENIEILDTTVIASIKRAYRANLGFFSAVKASFDIIVGVHYDELYFSDHYYAPHTKNAKGVLDYLFVPLLSRIIAHELWADLEKREGCSIVKQLLLTPIVIATESFRLCAGVALMALVLPIIGLMHFIKACRQKNDTANYATTVLQP